MIDCQVRSGVRRISFMTRKSRELDVRKVGPKQSSRTKLLETQSELMEEIMTCRPLYPHELRDDPDFSWLLANFREKNPNYILIDLPAQPVVLVAGSVHALAALPQGPSAEAEAKASAK